MKRHPEKRSPAIELQAEQEPNTEARIRAIQETVADWMRELVAKPPEAIERLNLSENRQLGAMTVPVVMFSILTGCYRQELVECTKSENGTLSATKDWMLENPDKIQDQMDQLWPNTDVTAEQMIGALNDASIECGISSGKDESIEATARRRKNMIIVGVDSDTFKASVANFETGGWTEDYPLEELLDMYVEDIEEDENNHSVQNARSSYAMAITGMTDFLAHEAIHLLEKEHSKEVRQTTKELTEDGKPMGEEAAYLDPIYGWGAAARNAASQWRDWELDRFIDTYHNNS